MGSSLRNLAFWVGAVVVVVAATVLYQPAAAKTGALLIWMNNRIYVMDIDTLVLNRVGAVGDDEMISASPGCFGTTATPCWVIGGQRLYTISLEGNNASYEAILPIGGEYEWLNSEVSWSPDGVHVAYSVRDPVVGQAELRIYNVAKGSTPVTIVGVDPAIAVAWTEACAGGLNGSGCQIAYKKSIIDPVEVVAFTPATSEEEVWRIDEDLIYELRWSATNQLLYSQPPRHFYKVSDGTASFEMPSGGQLANLSPDGNYTVYYQPFTLSDCQGSEEDCLNLGVWLNENDNEEKEANLIYNIPTQEQIGGLNFIPTWAADGSSFVFFQDGNLIHYDLTEEAATIWYKSIRGKLRSAPVFSPNEAAVAFVDNQGQGFSEYRLVVVDPKLQPVEHIIETKTGFRILAWLPQ